MLMVYIDGQQKHRGKNRDYGTAATAPDLRIDVLLHFPPFSFYAIALVLIPFIVPAFTHSLY